MRKQDEAQEPGQSNIVMWAMGALFIMLQIFLGAWMQRLSSDVSEIRARADRVLAIEAQTADIAKHIDRIDAGLDKLLGRR